MILEVPGKTQAGHTIGQLTIGGNVLDFSSNQPDIGELCIHMYLDFGCKLSIVIYVYASTLSLSFAC